MMKIGLLSSMCFIVFSCTCFAQDTLIVQGRNVYIDCRLLIVQGRSVYSDCRKLSQNEVRQLMGSVENIDALRLYYTGIKRNKKANIFFITGGSMIGGGLLLAWANNFDDSIASQSGAYVAITGLVGMINVGTILKIASEIPIRQSVEMYNNNIKRTNMVLDFGITGNGIGVTLRF